MKKQIMIGVGEILWDLLPGGRKLGGAPANFAYHCCQLNNRGVVISSVGDDEDGETIRGLLTSMNVEHLLGTSDYPTGTVTVAMDSDGVPQYTIHQEVAWDYLEVQHTQMELAAHADAICYGTLAQRNSVSAKTITEIIQSTPQGCHRIYDINLRQNYYSKKIVVNLLNLSTIVKLNDEELQEVAGMLSLPESEDTCLEELLSRFSLDLVIVTNGSRGSRLYSKEMGDSSLPGAKIKIADTVGAGDSFTAAVATGLCNGLQLREVHQFASNVASYVCAHSGATPQLPPIETFTGFSD